MALAKTISPPSKRDPAVAAIVSAWRKLASPSPQSDRRTLLACSAGADSSALVLALAAVTDNLVVAHVVHDIRPDHETQPDRDAAQALAQLLDLPFVETSIAVRSQPGNAEASARKQRYEALERLAFESGCQFVATGHHADDELETLLMGLLRGAGLRGLAGVARRRNLGTRGIKLIRPMLGIERSDAERLCTEAHWQWQDDLTNQDRTRVRAALRHEVLPVLGRLRPGAAARAARSGGLLRDAAGLVEDHANRLLDASVVSDPAGGDPPGLSWPRRTLQPEREIVLGELLRLASMRLLDGIGKDRLGSGVLQPAVRAIRDASTEPRQFCFSGVALYVDAHQVALVRKDADV